MTFKALMLFVFMASLLAFVPPVAVASPCIAMSSSEPEIKNILDQMIRPNTDQLQLIVLPDCRGYSPRQPNQPTKWFFHVLFYNPGPRTKMIYFFRRMQISSLLETAHLFIPILRKNNIPIFDRFYYQDLYKNPPAISPKSIPETFPFFRHFSQSEPMPPVKLASLRQKDTRLAMRGAPGRAIVAGEYFKTGIELFGSLKQPQQLIGFPDDPSLLPFLFRYHHKAFPYNHPAKYQIQFAFHQGKGLGSAPRSWPYWQGTIYSNIVDFEVK